MNILQVSKRDWPFSSSSYHQQTYAVVKPSCSKIHQSNLFTYFLHIHCRCRRVFPFGIFFLFSLFLRFFRLFSFNRLFNLFSIFLLFPLPSNIREGAQPVFPAVVMARIILLIIPHPSLVGTRKEHTQNPLENCPNGNPQQKQVRRFGGGTDG
jgi:hypothetical protein